MSDWPDCPNCGEPAAPNKMTGQPRKYCSDECMTEFPWIMRAIGVGAKDVPGWWPACVHCRTRPRSVANVHRMADGPVHHAARESRAHWRDVIQANPGATYLYKFCSTACRDEFMAPVYAPDLLDDLIAEHAGT
ncbi:MULTISPECIES: hypothetical protein [Pseudonocardia]|uniref:Uncharacterized protein n=2 Tax=Pseudonocardia TaxID=1847 RepID=A0A1Y2N917_PSEAH|nr:MULTISPECIES: hypothetical protein [Pseudonocardia]OSY43557.1 hypothetical protein BG845_00500 [Pseudonocardia autotrophica]TDN73452.1 hypothetical protein C8E95_2549 [Pseudonocardia autotrophica]BBG04193.1 hypothetical protein Pdca_54020 [Pseudonocardia autotrophica]GEC25524.1 hypothetical protein PSA01_25530 [Pseudonocardia saturnea]